MLIGLYEGFISSPLKLDALPFSSSGQGGSKDGLQVLTLEEVQKHNSEESAWIIVGDKVYDVTDFLHMHPGGADIILRHAGKDVDEIFSSIHSPTVLKMLRPDQCVGMINVKELPSRQGDIEEQARIKRAREAIPPVAAMVNLYDFEEIAKKVLSNTAWAYYSSAAEDEASHANNLNSFKRYWFRPRVMRAVADIDMKTSILGIDTALPIFVSPAALAGLGHPEGEVNITRGAGKAGIIQGISSNASRTIEDIAAARIDGQALFFQLYINKDRKESERIVRQIDDLGFKGIMLTVDAPVLGKRERDIRNRPPVSDDETPGGKRGVSANLDSFFEVNLQWTDVAWLKGITSLPIVIKGIQTVEDVELAIEHGADAVYLSCHGGRQLDYAPAAMDVLWELRQRRPECFAKAEIYIDGGVRRGSDVVKALALGAKAVGLGRPFLYANGTYGERGVKRAIEILEEEIATTMRLVGARSLSELVPDMVQRDDVAFVALRDRQ
ncbi:Cytochrome b2, mitochondrial precursor [Serendipita sp. 400]|nr:Cytochrome b2, mitochondrial precursor [Serendipita sp. 400]